MHENPDRKYPINDLNPTERQIIKFVYRWNKQIPPNTRDIANQLNLPQSTVTSTLKRMKDSKGKNNIFDWEPHHGVALTSDGEGTAAHIENHHHILELFLHRSLDIDENMAHQESELLGIAMSCNLTEKIYEKYNLTIDDMAKSCICPDDDEEGCVFE